MNPRAPLDSRLLEALSAYLDGRLESMEKAALEERLSREEDLRLHLLELQAVRDSLRALPSIKPPRALTLTHAQAGVPVRRAGWFSSRQMTLGSALAAMAFVVVFSVDLVSRGFLPGASSPLPESFAAPAQLQAADRAAMGGGEAYAPTSAAQPSFDLPAPSNSGPLEKTGGEASATPNGTPPPVEPASDGCGAPSIANQAAERCGLDDANFEAPAPKRFSLPDFRTLAPYLEVFLGLTTVILAALAIFFRRRK
jgi:hypothetical protein